jgi:hypothetical protein
MRRLLVLLGSVSLIAGCIGTPPPAPTATPIAVAPTATPAPATVTPRPTTGATSTLRPTPTPVSGQGICPDGSPLTVVEFSNSDPACFGSADVEIRGWLDFIPDMGFEAPLVEPTWIYYPTANRAIWSEERGPDQTCLGAAAACTWFFAHADPAAGLDLDRKPGWVILTGHLDDPAARTCHFVYTEDWTEPPLDNADAVATCRSRFVIVSFSDAP